MKKIVFAIQVFGLIALFPIYVVAELNHGNGRLPINNSSIGNIKEAPEKNILSTLNSADKNVDAFLFMFKLIHY